MTTNTKPEYVTDVEHSVACRSIDDRKALYLIRCIAQTQAAYFNDSDGISSICEPEERQWEFEETLEPMKLFCSSCAAERYVAQDEDGNIIALTPKNCIRASSVYGHFRSYYDKPCEYCGYAGKGGAL